MSGRKAMVHYALEVKREAVRLVEEEHLPYEEVAKRLAIRRAERIERWWGCIGRKVRYPFTNQRAAPER